VIGNQCVQLAMETDMTQSVVPGCLCFMPESRHTGQQQLGVVPCILRWWLAYSGGRVKWAQACCLAVAADAGDGGACIGACVHAQVVVMARRYIGVMVGWHDGKHRVSVLLHSHIDVMAHRALAC